MGVNVALIRRRLGYIYEVVTRKALGPLGLSRFGFVGKDAKVYKPLLLGSDLSGVSVGTNSIIHKGARLQTFPTREYPRPKISIGDNCYIGYFLSVLSGADVIIGNDVLIASNVLIASENHGMDPECGIPYMDQALSSSPVSIGDGCWIGERVIVLPGVSIGAGAIIGAASVVSKDIPAHTIALGSPARVVKKYDFDLHRWVKIS